MENLIFCEALKFNDRVIVKRNMYPPPPPPPPPPPIKAVKKL